MEYPALKKTGSQAANLAVPSLVFVFAALGFSSSRACTDVKAAISLGAARTESRWTEVDIAGRTIDRESGSLPGQQLGGAIECGDWSASGQLSHFDGTRAYSGQTSIGVPVQTQSSIRQTQGYAQLGRKVRGALFVGGRLAGQKLTRDIASAGGASGYPEEFTRTVVSLGTQWNTPSAWEELTLSAWVGTAIHQSLRLTLPGRDPAKLPLGRLTQWELGAQWRKPLLRHWHLLASVKYISTSVRAGDNAVISRHGIPSGVAHQPRTNTVEVPVTVGIGYEF